MAKKKAKVRKQKLSLWVCVSKPNLKAMEGIDILRDLCGVDDYDLDSQELSAITDRFPKAKIEELIDQLSYSSTFRDAAIQAAHDKGIKNAYWVLAQFDFVFKSKAKELKTPITAPEFLGVFEWDDSEDDS